MISQVFVFVFNSIGIYTFENASNIINLAVALNSLEADGFDKQSKDAFIKTVKEISWTVDN